MNLRITTITLKNGKEEYLISNLPMNEFTHNDIKEIYRLRWEVETLYDRLKNLLLVENVRGRTKLIVEQDFYSQLIIYNIVMDMAHEAGLERQKRGIFNDKEKKRKINISDAIGFFKSDIIEIILEPDKNKRNKMFDKLIERISKETTQTTTETGKKRPPKGVPKKVRQNYVANC